MKKLSATLIATLCLWTLGILTSQILYAQTRSHLEYAFGHVIETSLGCAFTCNDNGFVPGPELNLRYTYYWGKHFGVYGHIGGSINPKSVTSTFSKLDDSYNYAPLQYKNKKNTRIIPKHRGRPGIPPRLRSLELQATHRLGIW